MMKLHPPYNRLKGAMREKGMTYANMSEYLGISKATFCRKINGESDFYMSEAEKLEAKGFAHNIFYPKSFELNNKQTVIKVDSETCQKKRG